MAFSPPPRMAAVAADKGVATCGECEKQPATIFCVKCGGELCAECDTHAHAKGLRKDHQRVPISKRPVFCSIHNEVVKAYCVEEKRLACAQCLARLVGTCEGHPLKTIDEVAAEQRKDVELLHAAVIHNIINTQEETERLQVLRGAFATRLGQLATSNRRNCVAELSLEQLLAIQDNTRFITAVNTERERSVAGMGTAVGLVQEGEEELRRLCGGVGGLAGKIKKVEPIAARETIATKVPSFATLRPNLTTLRFARAMPDCPAFKSSPTEIRAVRDDSYILTDRDGGPAMRVWPDGSRDPQQLPYATAKATCVLPVEGGYLVVSYDEGRVERTGSTAWKRKDLTRPWAAVAVGDTVLVTEGGAGKVVRLDLRTGATLASVTVTRPFGIAQHPTSGHIFVASRPTNVAVLDPATLALLRTISAPTLSNPLGLCIDDGRRLYVADHSAKALVVLDATSGTELARVAVPGNAYGVAVTRSGTIMVSHGGPSGIALIDS